MTVRVRGAPTGVTGSGTGLVVSLVVGAIGFSSYALWVGQDANWDLQNYHLYVAYALLYWRYPLDVGPGGFQSYLNPLPYLLPYLLRSTLSPPAAAIGLAVSQAIIVPATWLLTDVMPSIARSTMLRALATLMASTSATALSEVGTSFADLTLAPLVVVSVFMLLRYGTPPYAHRTSYNVIAGLLLGVAAGLKLTNCIYMLACITVLIIPVGNWAKCLQSVFVFLVGSTLGLAATGGAWAAYLYASYDNPVFPALNSWFYSSSAALSDFTDKRFLPSSLVEMLAYPIRIAVGDHPTAENSFSDPRIAVSLIISIPFCLMSLYRHHKDHDSVTIYRAIAFLWTSYVVWVLAFAIQRYAVALEIIASVITMEIVSTVAGKRFQLLGCLTVLVGALSITRPADWWHRPWNNAFEPRTPAPLVAPAAFMIVSSPNGYWATILPEASRFYTVVPIGLATGGLLRTQLVAGLKDAPGHQVWTLGFDIPMDAPVRANMAALGYVPAAPCIRAASLWWVDTVFCHAAPVGKRPRAAADLKQNEAADFTSSGPGWIYEVNGWVNAGSRGTSTIGPNAELALRPEPSPSKSVLEFGFDGASPMYDVQVHVNGKKMARWKPTDEQAPKPYTVCLPDLVDNGGVADLVMQSEAGRPLDLTLRSLTLRSARENECGV